MASNEGVQREQRPERPRGQVLFEPSVRLRAECRLTHFACFARDSGAYQAPSGAVDGAAYSHLHAWSVEQPEAFWRCVGEFFGISELAAAPRALSTPTMPGARWFEGAELNYASYALAHDGGDTALVYRAEDGRRETVSYAQLKARVQQLASVLKAQGIGRGDRVVGFLPNCPEAVVGFLATVALGAVWSSCPPEFGLTSVLDRFGQIAPKALLAVERYSYGGKVHDKSGTIQQLITQLPTVTFSLVAARAGEGFPNEPHLTSDPSAQSLAMEAVPFEHPLWILYSSGTTGKPKAIVHCHGGILLEHFKVLGLHSDLRSDSTFFWYTTTGWMMWNFLVGGLLLGARVVLYDGSPGFPDLSALWRMADEEGVSLFGVSAPYLMNCRDKGLVPAQQFQLARLEVIGSTGAPLPAEGFEYVNACVKPGVALHSICGGTDVCTAFLLGAPWLPVRAGELSCAALGADVKAFNERGEPVLDETGELVLTLPMPSMPVMLWGDHDGRRLKESYFEHYPGVWRHGDWIIQHADQSYVVLGRSDATLNRGGIRMGTSEFYSALGGIPEIADSLVVDTSTPGGDGLLWLFVVLTSEAVWSPVLRTHIETTLRRELSPRHVPDHILSVPDIPYTLSGKKLEVPVKRVLMGASPNAVAAPGTLRNPAALDAVVSLARHSLAGGTAPT